LLFGWARSLILARAAFATATAFGTCLAPTFAATTAFGTCLAPTFAAALTALAAFTTATRFASARTAVRALFGLRGLNVHIGLLGSARLSHHGPAVGLGPLTLTLRTFAATTATTTTFAAATTAAALTTTTAFTAALGRLSPPRPSPR